MAASLSLRSELELAGRTGWLDLSGRGLVEIPAEVLQLKNLRRLDLSNNEMTELGAEILSFPKLEELWLAGNPLHYLDPAVAKLMKLAVLDLCNTALRMLPDELSQLPNLMTLDLRGTELEGDVQHIIDAQGAGGLVMWFARQNEARDLRKALVKSLSLSVYGTVSDTPQGATMIDGLADDIMAAFPDPAELNMVIRNAARLFPEELAAASGFAVRQAFEGLQKANRRKQLGAELELKVRAIYFGNIEPEEAYTVVHRCMERFKTLAEVRFLLQHAKALLPEDPAAAADVEALHGRMTTMRDKLRQERQAAVQLLVKALLAHYPGREPPEVERLGAAVAKSIRSTEQLRSLGADVQDLFPAEFTSARPSAVVAAFRELQKAKGVE